MIEQRTYLLPIWVDLKGENPEGIISALNGALLEFFEEQSELIADTGHTVDIQWSINQHLTLGGRAKS
jgi:hypothetical protein